VLAAHDARSHFLLQMIFHKVQSDLPGPMIRRKRHESMMSSVMGMSKPMAKNVLGRKHHD
jgi:hypothetical protein